MSKYLVIVESPAKARTINKILGKEYTVKASVGHVRDLPKTGLGVDIEKGFQPNYVTMKDKSKVLTELRKAAKDADEILLAPDPDREGEAIAWHLKEALKSKVPEERFRRVTYNEITAPAIREAFSKPTVIDQQMVDAQQARRVLDRIVGYQVSPLLWRRFRGGRSAGRVQTVALRILTEREKQILQFVPEPYWVFSALARKRSEPTTPFDVRLAQVDGAKADIRDKALSDSMVAELAPRHLQVAAVNRKEIKRRPKPPFITSSLQQAASSFLSFNPGRTMRVAQRLYEAGLITYMRTDSFNLSDTAVEATRELIAGDFGPDYLPEKPNRYKSKGGAQEAHEAIRPTDLALKPADARAKLAKDDEHKLYEMIWKRTVASQMTPARIAQLSIDFAAVPAAEGQREYTFRGSASEILFPGFLRAMNLDEQKGKAEAEDTAKLPPLAEGEELDVDAWQCDEKETQPPSRFSEAALIRALEENGVGRPSTYAATIQVLYDRDYVENEKRSLRPTELGMQVCDYLCSHLGSLFEIDFTARMEESLDEIEQGDKEWHGMLGEFYKSFEVWLEAAKTAGVDLDVARRLVGLMDKVTEWAPPAKIRNKTYSDEKFHGDLRDELEKEEPEISERQINNLRKMVCRYRKQIPEWSDELVQELDLIVELEEAKKAEQPMRESTALILEVLGGGDIEFDEPRKVGKRTYDDKAFCESLGEQIASGKRLTDRQSAALVRIFQKYEAKIPNFEQIAERIGLEKEADDTESGPLLKLLETVTEWAEPTTRGKKTWSDQGFYESLSEQFKSKGRLSDRQRTALKRTMSRYASQIPDYEAQMEPLGLLPPKAPKKATAKKKASAKKKAAGAKE